MYIDVYIFYIYKVDFKCYCFILFFVGGCKHGIAFFMWCNRRYESLSPTEVECYWKKSTLSSIGTAKKFIKACELTESQCKNDLGSLRVNGSIFLTAVIQ